MPPAIRAYLTEGKYTPVAKNMMSKYNLRVDQGGVLERELMLLLMGVEDPSEFTKTLVEEARLDQKTANSIAQDVNNQIFIPLRAEEMRGDLRAEKPVPPAAAPMPAAPAPLPPAVAGEPKKYFHLENKIPPVRPALAPTPAPVRPAPVVVTSVPTAAPAAPRPTAPLPPRFSTSEATMKIQVESRNRELPPRFSRSEPKAALSTPISPEATKLLEDHEEPHIEFNQIPTPVASTRPTMDLGAGAPPNLPGAMPPQAVPAIPMPPRPAVAPGAGAPVEPKPVAATPTESYGADPYREPIDEPPA